MTQTKAELLQTRHQGDIRLGDADSTHYVGFKAPATVGTSLVWTLPAADGTANYLLKTDGSGNLGWVADSTTDSTKMPLAGGIFTGDVTFDGATAGRDIVFDRSDNALEFADNAKATFGSSADLLIKHDGSNSYIQDNGTGALIITAADQVVFQKGDGTNRVLDLHTTNGTAALLYQGNTHLITTNTGATVTGRLLTDGVSMGDNEELLIGTGNDFKLRHDGTDNHLVSSNGDINIQVADSENAIICKPNGAVELYHDNSKKFQTTSTGAHVWGNLDFMDNAMIRLGTNTDLELVHDGTNSRIKDTGSGNLKLSGSGVDIENAATTETMASFIADGAVELYHNNVKKFETVSYGVVAKGSVEIQNGSMTTADSTNGGVTNSVRLGTGNDLSLFHDGSNSYINNAIGELVHRTQTWHTFANHDGGETLAVFKTNGGCELYYDNVKKIETTTQAVKITGGIAQVVTAAAALELDLNTSNYFTKTISGNSTFTFANPAASGQVTAFTLELTHSSGTVTWPSSVKWNEDTAPTLTTGKTHLFMFVTDDGGTRYRGSALVDYVN